jgi:cytochrome c oxidase subunit 1
MSPSQSQVNPRMSQEAIPDTAEERVSYLAEGHSLRSWLTTTDHKRIAILFLIAITFFFFCGGIAAALIRLDLLTPAPDLLSNDGGRR